MVYSEHVDQELANRVYEHIIHLADEIGPRGSCTQGEVQAAQYVASVFHSLGLDSVQTQDIWGAPTAYGRYAVAIGIALLSQVLAGWMQSGWSYIIAGVISGLCAWAMYAESDFRPNWTHWLIRSHRSQNILAHCPARKTPEHQVVITAHIDTHRTPFFNSNATWQRLYNRSFRLIFISLVISAGLTLLKGVTNLVSLEALSIAVRLPPFLGLLAFLQADRTPFSPGAYDNASGVACALGIAELLAQKPLENTAIWVAATGCEETGAGGMFALVNSRAESWRQALWINLDQTGIGQLYLRLEEGMLRRYAIQPSALQLARQSSEASGIPMRERHSQAFSDAIIANQRGLLSISLGASPTDQGLETPRHQLSDVPAAIQPETLYQTIDYVWGMLSLWDQQERGM